MKLYTKRHIPITRQNPTAKIALLLAVILAFGFLSCHQKAPPPKQEIVNTPEQMKETVPDVIKAIVGQLSDNGGKVDTISILQPELVKYLYDKNNDEARWSREAKWTPAGSLLIKFIENARLYGLFPDDYHFGNISGINQQFETDSEARKDAVRWSKADVLLTDGLLQIINHVKLGRLPKDSITLRTDSVLTKEFYEQQVEDIIQSISVTRIVDSLEPSVKEYHDLKEGIKDFLDSAVFKDYTRVPYPIIDTPAYRLALRTRLFEESLLDSLTDSVHVPNALKKYQAKMKLKVDGKAGAETIRSLNLTDKDKFARIALSLDKYKMLPAKMPEKYVWVNLAGYYMQLKDSDSVKISSRVVIGKPLTRTPELTSSISEMITYPQWSVPQSIIVKEFLPELKKDPGYLAKKGFSLLDMKNEEVDPYFVDWSKYKLGIPYKIVQGSGDDNALGIMKFNFPNKYAVYLHDTNQRYLFAQSSRALSHGCVRVQEWQKLCNYILQNDSTYVTSLGNNSFTKADSVSKWLGKKEKHFIPVKFRIPLFIRYFTCEGKDGKIVFYDDIYDEDNRLKEK
ncbi:MAG TPA: L,D-transpeptidase family protein, partial [Chitinophagaceae bacterium]|nr:L,D-transpeptidase family protein [Chitinophagaceae bacterium]